MKSTTDQRFDAMTLVKYYFYFSLFNVLIDFFKTSRSALPRSVY